jgi:hypothetical protein
MPGSRIFPGGRGCKLVYVMCGLWEWDQEGVGLRLLISSRLDGLQVRGVFVKGSVSGEWNSYCCIVVQLAGLSITKYEALGIEKEERKFCIVFVLEIREIASVRTSTTAAFVLRLYVKLGNWCCGSTGRLENPDRSDILQDLIRATRVTSLVEFGHCDFADEQSAFGNIGVGAIVDYWSLPAISCNCDKRVIF